MTPSTDDWAVALVGLRSRVSIRCDGAIAGHEQKLQYDYNASLEKIGRQQKVSSWQMPDTEGLQMPCLTMWTGMIAGEEGRLLAGRMLNSHVV
jgi:hypothetical protein